MRFVVLHHTDWGLPHYDFMLQGLTHGDTLMTFRAPRWPICDGDTLERLPEHRAHYLEYEGPLSGGRGVVSRVAMGEFQVVKRLSRSLELRLVSGWPGGEKLLDLRQDKVRPATWIAHSPVLKPDDRKK